MDIVLSVLGWIIVLVGVIYGLGFVLPDHQKVARSIKIEAAPDVVFGWISDLEKWSSWSPWADIDPDMKMVLDGRGVGQTMTWTSDHKNVGSGRQEIIALEAPSEMRTRLNFGDMGGADAAFQLSPVDGGTEVVWSLDTQMRSGVPVLKQPMATYFGFFMDKMVGADYEKGLAKLKTVVEAERT